MVAGRRAEEDVTARADWKVMQRAIRRLAAYGQMWKWGSDCGRADIALAEEALEALKRRRDGIARQLALWEEEPVDDARAWWRR